MILKPAFLALTNVDPWTLADVLALLALLAILDLLIWSSIDSNCRQLTLDHILPRLHESSGVFRMEP